MLIKNLFRYWTYQLFAPEKVLKEKYQAFKVLLTHDKAAHEHLAALEDIYYNNRRYDFQAVVKTYEKFSGAVSGMVDALLTMNPSKNRDLQAYFKKFDFYVRFILAPQELDLSSPFTVAFDRAASFGAAVVGNKAFNLSHLAKVLHLPTPDGFVITTRSFHYFLQYNGLQAPINEKLAMVDISDAGSLEETSAEIEALILNAALPFEIEQTIAEAMEIFQQNSSKDTPVALRSSAAKEDGIVTFAGQYRTLLNVKSGDILDSYKRVIAGKYSPRALYYRINHGILDDETPMAVLVLEMVDAMAAGVVYTRDFEAPDSDNLVIHSVRGGGEALVDGKVSPDVFRISRENSVLDAYTARGEADMASLDESSLLTLAHWALSLEAHFKYPQDIEWCQDSEGRLFLLQSRPLHMGSTKIQGDTNQGQNRNKNQNTVLCSGGEKVSSGFASGPVYKLDETFGLEDMPRGAVLVVRNASPRFVTAIDRMAAVVVASGSSASHFSSVAREFGVPAIVNVEQGFENLIHGQGVTVDADNGMVYEGISPEFSAGSRTIPLRREILFKESSFMVKLEHVIGFSAKLKLTDPESDDFVPQGCRSLHDIVRFAHETAMREMFFMGDRKGRPARGAKKLVSSLPMLFYLLDVGMGINEDAGEGQTLTPDDIASLPMKWVLGGLLTPGIHWSETTHFDWETHDQIVLAGGIVRADSPRFGSYAVVSKEYANINFRFGYHFVILDSLCTALPEDNYILFRFSGGGADPWARILRASFIGGILTRLGFTVMVKSDLVDGELKYATLREMEKTLEMVGRLLGATKLMDMYIKEEQDIGLLIDEFMEGRYDFRTQK